MTSFYSLDEAKTCNIEGKRPFIIAEEKRRCDGSIGRIFTVFSSFYNFLEERDEHPHCHEIIADHVNTLPLECGRLVFDLDRENYYNENEYVPKGFQSQFEDLVMKVITKYYTGVDLSRIEFVWMTSPNLKKYSKHLVVKNFSFRHWLTMAKDFYKLLEIEWSFEWCKIDEIIDLQIIRKSGSLRMAGSSKIGGSVIKIDRPEFDLEDSLIRIYRKSYRKDEQIIEPEQMIHRFPVQEAKKKFRSICQETTVPEGEFKVAYSEIEKTYPGIFQPGRITGNYMTLTRVKESICPFSDKLHERIDGFLEITDHVVRFGCYRKCAKIYSKQIGIITQGTLIKLDEINKPRMYFG